MILWYTNKTKKYRNSQTAVIWKGSKGNANVWRLWTCTLLVGVGVGVWVLRKVKGEHFTDDAVSLLRERGKKRVMPSFKSITFPTSICENCSMCVYVCMHASIFLFCYSQEDTNLWVDSNEWVCLCVKLLLQRDDNGLEVHHWLVFDVVGHLHTKMIHQSSNM